MFERFIGTKGLIGVGILVLLLGLSFWAKASVDKEGDKIIEKAIQDIQAIDIGQGRRGARK